MDGVGDHVPLASFSSPYVRKDHNFTIGDEKLSLAGPEKLYWDFSISSNIIRN
jgi:hypothetical protein